jgi:hypothetical protein
MRLKKPKQKIIKEDQSRKTLFTVATQMGCQVELAQIFNRYDRLLKNCANQTEIDHISLLGIAEVNKLMSFVKNAYSVDGVNVENL